MSPLRVLLLSQPGGGKTTVCTRVHDALRASASEGGLDGFLSREVRSARGLKVGYELHSLDDELWETLASSEGPPSGVTVAKYFVYVDGLERVTLPVLDRVLAGSGPRLCIIDDVGGMTCKSESFVDRAFALLSSSDPDLHALVALGAGGSTTLEMRRVRGVTSVTVDTESRDCLPDSLCARFQAALGGKVDPIIAEGDNDLEDDDEDIDGFDAWGGDSRQLGAKRGLYSPSAAPPSLSGTEESIACDTGVPSSAIEASSSLEEMDRPAEFPRARGRGRGMARMAGSDIVQASQADDGNAEVEDRSGADIQHGRGRGRGLRVGVRLPASEDVSLEAAPVLSQRGRGRARGRGATETPHETCTSGIDVAAVPGRAGRGRGRGRIAASESVSEDACHGRGRGRGQNRQGVVPTPCRNEAGIIAWLEKIDDGKGVLMQTYGEAIKERFDLLSEVFEVYLQSGGDVSGAFFEDFGVTKVGHKRLFEKSFRESRPLSDTATGA